MDKVLAAFTMSEMERLQGIPVANFKRGKDKKKRKKRGLGFAAGVGAAGAAGLAGIGAAARYGGAEISQRRRASNIAKDFIGPIPAGTPKADVDKVTKAVRAEAIEKGFAGRGARQTLSRDLDKIGLKEPLQKARRALQKAGDWGGNPIQKARAAMSSTDINAARGISQNAKIRSTGDLGNKARKAREVAGAVMRTRAGKIGVGLAGAAALGGVGALGYRALQGRKKNKGKK